MDLDRLTHALRDFVEERDWYQFQSPKNLAMALSVEAAELMEHFQWLRQDLLEAAEQKMERNQERYPAEKVRGSAKKAGEF